MKLVSEIVETSASVHVDLDRVTPVIPEDVNFPEGGVNIRWPDHGIQQEERLYKYRLPAVLAYARANKINTVTWPVKMPRRCQFPRGWCQYSLKTTHSARRTSL